VSIVREESVDGEFCDTRYVTPSSLYDLVRNENSLHATNVLRLAAITAVVELQSATTGWKASRISGRIWGQLIVRG
jgi:hypothetical protein